MTLDPNYESLVKLLMKEKRTSSSFESEIEIRPIPDNDKPGILDPREYALALETLKNRLETPKTIEAIRKQTTFPNRNLNKKEIETKILNINIKGRIIKVFMHGVKNQQGKRPAFVYVHGGSWFAGSTSVSENTCKYLAELMESYVFNIDVSLCPENPFPCAIEDVNGVLEYIFLNQNELNVDGENVSAIGDSSGANLILASIQMGLSFKLKSQILYYPPVCMDEKNRSFEWKESDYIIDEVYRPFIIPRLSLGRADGEGDLALMQMIMSLYLQKGESRANSLVSPIYSDLSIYPKTIIFTAEYDGLRQQGEFFGKLLKDAKVSTKVIRFNGIHHGFIDKFGVFPQAEASLLIVKEILEK